MKLKERFNNSRLLKPLATLLSGNVVAQGLTMLSYLIITRLYTPDDIGAFNIFYSYIELLIIISTCKYELAPVIADSDREATAVAKFSLRLNAIVSAIILLVVAVLSYYGLLPAKLRQIGWVTILIPFLVFFCGTTRIYASLYNRYKVYRQIALSDISISLGGALSKIAMGPIRFLHNIGLPLGTVIGQAIGNVNYLIALRKLNLPTGITRQEMKVAVQKHKKFPLYTAPKDFIDALSYNLPIIWLPMAMTVTNAEVGLFGMALLFTYRPVNVFNTAAERVLYANIADRIKSQLPVGAQVSKFVAMLNLIAIPVFLTLFFFAEPVFTVLFGSQWSGSAPYLHAIIPWMLILLTSNSLLCVPYAFSKQHIELVFTVMQLVLRVAALGIGLSHRSFLLAIQLYSAASALTALARIAFYAAVVYRYDHSIANK